ncbi:glycosyltransferase involved in cell wall biosynthesis [Desulfosalsimonas propionicica]|uniref:Glycosyltransferase involved in cell wall biosynthesis n=1 Tax=Desulfosalsimonas propionicica TaxID=332175 RepID=A0A7W0C820_9BACT|nr:glycosyltransferase family 2 protein [Desulfosalsimonas propionicica]MBA2880795.1 glycosyltransferase involved in cell wall biosynthesis [Desulfosalsimonas propionicica]
MKISFVIPTYNYGNFLERCLASVFQQDYGDYEVIVVDDGSTDNTIDVISRIQQQYPEKKIDYIFQKNAGPSVARNNGVAKAAGEYVWCLDADDQLIDGAVRKMVRAAEINPQAWLLFSGFQAINEKGKIVKRPPSPLGNDRTENFRRYILKKVKGLCMGTALVRREAFDLIRFPSEVAVNEDVVFYSKVLVRYQAVSVSGFVLTVNRHKGSQRYNIAKMQEAGLNTVDNIFNKNLLTAEQMGYRSLYLTRWYLTLFRAHFRNRRFKEARGYYKQAVKERPIIVFRLSYLRKYLRSFRK